LDKTYDIVIIGSGLSGLVCGYILSKEGYNVCILEKNKQVGGCLQTFVRDKCIFDVGVHYIGSLSKGQSLHQIFKYFGIMDDLNLEQMDKEAFDVISFDGDEQEYAFAQGYDRFVDQMSSYFPKERVAIQKYTQLIQDVCNKFPLYSLDINRPYPKDLSHLGTSAKEAIESLTSNKTLQAVLGGNNLLYAGRGKTTPLYIHAMVINGYIKSAWRCVNGGSQIARLMIRGIRKNGGSIYKRKEVDRFVFDGNHIKEVVLTTGESIATKNVISSAHPAQLARFVQGSKGKLRKAYLNRIKSIPPTPSVFSAHYVLEPNTVEYINRNYYHNKNKKPWAMPTQNHSDWPSCYLALTPKTSRTSSYAESFAIMTYMEYEEVQRWKDSFNIVGKENDRGADYEAFKEEKMEKLLHEACKKFPQLKGNIKSGYASTPLSFRDYIGSPTGSLYGFEKSAQYPMLTAFTPQTRIPNLYLTGQNINVHGILGVTISGILACFQFVERKKLLKDIVSA